MGHYFSEMFPAEAARRDERIARLSRIHKGLKNVPLEKFTVGEFEVLMHFFKDWYVTGYSPIGGLDDDGMKLLEQKIAVVKTVKTGKRKRS